MGSKLYTTHSHTESFVAYHRIPFKWKIPC